MHTTALKRTLQQQDWPREIMRPWVPGALAAVAALLALMAVVIEGPRRAVADVSLPYIGVLVADAPERGAEIVTVIERGPADEAGLRTGDVITRFGAFPVRDAEAFRRVLLDTQVGAVVPVMVERGDQPLAIPVRVSEPPGRGPA